MKAKVLSKEQINQIHQASIKILERIGVFIPHEEILKSFEDYGAKVNRSEKRVRIPNELVMELISKSGKKFTIYGRDLSKKAEFGVGKRNYNTTAGQAFWLDNIGQKRRYAAMNDVLISTKFADS